MNPLRSLLKFVLGTGCLIGIICLLLYISGYGYILSAVNKSILVGQSGPSIHDLEKFPYRTIKTGKETFEWNTLQNPLELNSQELEFHKNLGSESFLVIQNNTLLCEKYWEGKTLLAPSNTFSMAKTLVGSLAAIAVGEGKINWADPIGTYWKEIRDQDISNLTFYQLLTMSANTSWKESGGNPFSSNAEAYYGTDLIATVTDVTLTGKEGKSFNYQSGNTTLAAVALSKAVGTSLSDYASEKIWSKIGASADAFWSLDEEGGAEKSFCCLYANSRDYAKLGKLWLQQGIWDSTMVIPPYEFEKLVSPAKIDFDKCDAPCYGISFWLESYAGISMYYARGILGQYIIVIPEKNLIIVRTGNKRASVNDRCHPEDLYAYVDQALRIADEHEKGY